MIKDILQEISSVIDSLPSQLKAIPVHKFNEKPVGKWSKKEILGHLTDSATVNTQRLIRGQTEDSPQIYYEQDEWVSVQAYQSYKDESLIILWESLNRHFVHIASHIPEKNLLRTCVMKNGQPVSLAFLVEDYLVHLQHHIKQLMQDERP